MRTPHLGSYPRLFILLSRILTCLACLWLGAHAGAATYYVDSVAGSDTNAGTSSTAPWQTLSHVNNHAFQPGDFICLKTGSDLAGGLTVTASGTATAAITFNSYGSGARPIIRNNPAYGTYSDAVFLNNASYIVLDGLEFTGASEAGVRVSSNANYNTMRNCEVTNAGEGALVLGQYNLFTGNYIHDLIMVVNDTGSGKTDNDYGATGFVIDGSNNEFSYNTLLRCKAASDDYGTDGGGFELYGTMSNISIHHNWVQDCEGLLEGGAGAIQNVTLSYNVCLNNSDFLVLHTSGGFAGTLSNFLVENNTCVELTTNNPSSYVYLDSSPTSSQFIFRNNIVVVDNIGSIFKNDVPRNNNVYQFMSSATHMLNNWGNNLGPGEIKADPLFVAINSNDFRLTSASPAIGAGVAVGLTRDFIGQPVGTGAPCAGAYQYAAGSLTMVAEAESVPLTSPMTVYNDSAASGGVCISTPTTIASNIPDTLLTPSASYYFNVPATGTYTIWARVFAASGDNNSLYYAVNSPSSTTVYNLVKWGFYNQYGWVKVGTASLTNGVTDFQLKYRHHGGKFDEFLLTTDSAFTPTGTY